MRWFVISIHLFIEVMFLYWKLLNRALNWSDDIRLIFYNLIRDTDWWYHLNISSTSLNLSGSKSRIFHIFFLNFVFYLFSLTPFCLFLFIHCQWWKVSPPLCLAENVILPLPAPSSVKVMHQSPVRHRLGQSLQCILQFYIWCEEEVFILLNAIILILKLHDQW